MAQSGRAAIAVTHAAWFRHFRREDRLTTCDELNFRRPTAQGRLRTLQTAAPFFFRLKQPHSVIAGFGFFACAYPLPIHMAWAEFGAKNEEPARESFERGAVDYARFRDRAASAEGGEASRPTTIPPATSACTRSDSGSRASTVFIVVRELGVLVCVLEPSRKGIMEVVKTLSPGPTEIIVATAP